MESKSFYRNVFLLTQIVPPGKDFNKYFKEGMFDKPNTAGFIYVSHYLFTIYDEERFKKLIEWPILDKKDEGKYRNEVRDFMNIIASENPDFEFPIIQPSHLHTASGTRFINLIWKFSSIVLRTYLQRQGTETLNMAPKSGDDDLLTKNLLTNIIADEKKEILELHNEISKSENKAEIEADKMAKSIENSQKKWFEMKEKLDEAVTNAVVHPDIEKRLGDPNDTEIIEMWKNNLNKSINYIKNQRDILKELTNKTENVAAIVNSIVTSDSNSLDGNNLPTINTDKLIEIIDLEPETQVAIHHLYQNNKLNLINFLIIFKALLKNLRGEIQINKFPDFTDCNLQIEASTDDLKKMNEILNSLESKIIDLTKNIKTNINKYKNHDLSFQMDPDVFDSVVLKSSPNLHFNSNNQLEVYDNAERLELTPVENVHKSLFLRYKNNDTPTIPRPLKTKSKILVSRINFDDSISSTISEKFSPVKKPIKLFNQLSTGKSGKFSKLFTTNIKKSFNNTVASPGGWKTSINENSVTSDIYNMSDLKSHLTNKSSFNISGELSTPEKPNNQRQINYVDKPAFNSTEIINELSTISEDVEIRITVGASPRTQQTKKKEDNKKRWSIGDLVEKYKKLREQSANVTYLEHSAENSDDSTK